MYERTNEQTNNNNNSNKNAEALINGEPDWEICRVVLLRTETFRLKISQKSTEIKSKKRKRKNVLYRAAPHQNDLLGLDIVETRWLGSSFTFIINAYRHSSVINDNQKIQQSNTENTEPKTPERLAGQILKRIPSFHCWCHDSKGNNNQS